MAGTVKNTVYGTIILTAVWIILREDYAVTTVVSGVLISLACIFLSRRLLPGGGALRVNYFRLSVYLLYLIGQVYIAGIATIKIILTGARAEIVEFNTIITDKFLRTVLVNSITLVPGSVSLDITDDKITVLWLMNKKPNAGKKADPEYFIRNKLEKMLIKAQKRA